MYIYLVSTHTRILCRYPTPREWTKGLAKPQPHTLNSEKGGTWWRQPQKSEIFQTRSEIFQTRKLFLAYTLNRWYLSASNGPKNVIFILDVSGSMQQKVPCVLCVCVCVCAIYIGVHGCARTRYMCVHCAYTYNSISPPPPHTFLSPGSPWLDEDSCCQGPHVRVLAFTRVYVIYIYIYIYMIWWRTLLPRSPCVCVCVYACV